MLVQNGYENIEFIADITFEDLQEIGITKQGKTHRFTTSYIKTYDRHDTYSIPFKPFRVCCLLYTTPWTTSSVCFCIVQILDSEIHRFIKKKDVDTKNKDSACST